MALRGADFIEVFRFFLDAGQTETDSFASAQRVFRGAPLGGGAAFTKDTVYLHGLLSRAHLLPLGAARTSASWRCAATVRRQDGAARRDRAGAVFRQRLRSRHRSTCRRGCSTRNGLAGMLAFSLFANRIRLDRVEAEDLVLGL